MSILFTNARVILQERVLDNGAVRISDGIIKDVYEGEYNILPEDEVVDAKGKYLSPGFIDVHIHGGGGGYFMSGEHDQIDAVCKMHLKHGTTSMTPSLSTAPKEMLMKAMDGVNEYEKNVSERPNFLGFHLEGPYLSPNACGAMPPGYIRNPDPEEYMDLVEKYPNIVRWALAPELPGAIEMAQKLCRRGLKMSIAHSDALFDDAMHAYEAGVQCVTHFYSLTSTVRRINAYRYAGTLELAYLMDDMWVEVIADGKHLPATLLKLIYKLKGPDRIMLITDSISAGGWETMVGEAFSQTGMPIIIEDAVAKLPSREVFAGSIATTDRIVRTMHTLAEVPMKDAVKMASANPAKHLGIFNKKGSISVGKDADLVLFDDNVNIDSVYVMGKKLVQN